MGSQQQGTTVIPHMQELLNTWAGLLHAMDGALVLDKCFWYNIHNQLEKGAWRYAQPNPENKIQVPDDARKLIQIPQLAPGEARHTLGVRLAPDSNNKVEFFYLTDVAKSWQTSMAVAKITHMAVEFGLWQVIPLKIRIPSSSDSVHTTTMQTECNQFYQQDSQQQELSTPFQEQLYMACGNGED